MTKPVWAMDQIVEALTDLDFKWYTAPVLFSFYETAAPPLVPQPPNFQPLTAVQREAVRSGFELVADIANISFGEVADAPGIKPWIRFQTIHVVQQWSGSASSRTEETGENDRVIGTDITFNRYLIDQRGNYQLSDWNRMIVLHEILHALGLSHPGPYNGPGYNFEDHAVCAQDTTQYTVMSYWTADKSGADHELGGKIYRSATPLIHDIAALHAIYGANMATRTGDTVYGFNSTAGRSAYDLTQNPAPLFAIWDAGGTDTLDLSGYASGSRIDLEPGAFSDAGGLTSNISIAFGATVENAVGGSGDDAIAGNAAANRLTGGTGHDSVDGRGGDDVLDLAHGGGDGGSGGEGNDVIFFGGSFDGNDRAHGGAGTDTLVLQGNYAALLLHSDIMTGIEGLSLQSGTITRWGQSGANSYDYALTASEATAAPGQQFRLNAQSLQAGEDLQFNGAAETDGGRYLVYAGFGVDQLAGGEGNDVFFFEAGRLGAGDRIAGGGGNDAVVLSGAAAGAARLAAEIASGTLASVESLSFNGRFASDPSSRPSYEVVIRDGNIAPGERLIVNGSSLGGTQQLSVDGSAVTDGRLWLFGGAYADGLTAGSGDDLIYAAGGSDALRGGGGADLFQYRSAGDSLVGTQDRIYDFQHGADRIDLSQAGAFTVHIGGELSGAAGEVRVGYDADAGLWRVVGDVDGDGAADFLVEVIVEAGQPLTPGDFLL